MFIKSERIRVYFEQLTRQFLRPLEEYFDTLMPNETYAFSMVLSMTSVI